MTMGLHQCTVGTSQQHLTPRWILDPLGPFDLDPCASSPRPWDCAAENWTKRARQWFDKVWCNPPFHRYRIHGWPRVMGEHNRGIFQTHVRPTWTGSRSSAKARRPCSSSTGGTCSLTRRGFRIPQGQGLSRADAWSELRLVCCRASLVPR